MSSVYQLCEEFFEWRLRTNPEYATFCGYHQFDDQLNDTSVEAFERYKKDASSFLRKCEEYEELSPQISREDLHMITMLKGELDLFIKGVDFEGYLFPYSFSDGMHVDFGMLASLMPFQKMEDFDRYVKRLKCLPRRLASDEKLLKTGIEKSMVKCTKSMEGVVERMRKLITDNPDSSSLFEPFLIDCDLRKNPEFVKLKEEARNILTNDVFKAFKTLSDFIEKEYIPKCLRADGVHALPGGESFYKQCLKFHLSEDVTPADIHQLGLREVARVQQQMTQVMDEVGFKGSVREFSDHLKTKDDLYYTSREDLLDSLRHLADNVIRPKLSELFFKIPKAKLTIEHVPASKYDAPVGYYMAGTLDGSRPGVFYVNGTDLKFCPKYEMTALMLHEGEPGHHFQGMFAVEMDSCPRFIKYVEDINYYQVPSRFGMHTAYVEGWGLYCEYLGNELGLYDDPYSRFGYLGYEMHRACRLVVDTGLHAFGWSFDQAVNYQLDHMSNDQTDIENETKRYITMPGQACAYTIGMLKIRDLRTKATTQLGEKFDIRKFHDVVLRALPVPLATLEKLVDEYIQIASTVG